MPSGLFSGFRLVFSYDLVLLDPLARRPIEWEGQRRLDTRSYTAGFATWIIVVGAGGR